MNNYFSIVIIVTLQCYSYFSAKQKRRQITSYVLHNLEYSEEEKKAINDLKITKSDTFSYYGTFDQDSLTGFVPFLQEIGDNTEHTIITIKNIIQKLSFKSRSDMIGGLQSQRDHVWITIRIRLRNDDFNIVRWHFDGFQNQSKYATVLKGPGTLLIDDGDTDSKNTFFESFTKYSKDRNTLEYRNELATILSNAKIVQLSNDQAVAFKTEGGKNDIKHACIHSEPPMNESRVFFSIMWGTKEEIDRIKNARQNQAHIPKK